MQSGRLWGNAVGLALVIATLTFAQQPDARPSARDKSARPLPPESPAGEARRNGDHDQNGKRAGEPTLVLSASVASLDKLAAFAKEVGLGDLPFLAPEFLEQQLPFIGAGGLAGDRPIGVLLYGRPGVDLEAAATFVLPVNAGSAGLEQFADAGAKPLDEGKPDTVTLKEMGYRRGKDQFIFGQMPRAVAAVPEDALTSTYAGNESLARIDLDVAALKRAMPREYEQFVAQIEEATRSEDSIEQTATEVLIKPLRGLTRLGLSVRRTADNGVPVLSLEAEPITLPEATAGKYARPGFPEGTLFRADLGCPPEKLLAPWFDAVKRFGQADDAAGATEEQQEKLRALVTEELKVLVRGHAASLGVEMVAGRVVVYWVTRQPAGAGDDLERDMRTIAAGEQAMLKLAGRSRPEFLHETYTIGNDAKVHRMTLLDDGTPYLHIDAARRGDSRCMAFAAADGRYLQRILPLKAEGETTALLSGWLDLSVLAAADLLPDGEDTGLGETAIKELKAGLEGQRLAWFVRTGKDAIEIDVGVPKTVLQTLAKVAGLIE